MSLFDKIGSLGSGNTDTIGDDNIAVSTPDNNPYISMAVFGARNAYDTLHAIMAPMIKGKQASLRQIDRELKKWTDQLEKISKMYEGILNKVKDLTADFGGTFTLDFARDAWELIQDTPILRRYMGEANYWYLYDTVGLLATQPASFGADASSVARAAVKSALLGLISMTDGLICLESYLGMIQKWWGALYQKFLDIPLLESIVPNVTTAYWYKPVHSEVRGTAVQINVLNNPPRTGFTPVPVPLPSPAMVLKDPTYRYRYDAQNPDTWYLNGVPYYLPRSIELMERALDYWGSSYTGAMLPIVNDIYPRRDYVRDGSVQEHPLQVGQTFAQLDTDKRTINGTNMATDSVRATADIRDMLDSVFSKDIVALMDDWEDSYERARSLLLQYILSECTAYGETPTDITAFVQMQARTDTPAGHVPYITWLTTNQEFLDAVQGMLVAWKNMGLTYAAEHGLSGDEAYTQFFDRAMEAVVRSSRIAARISEGQTYMVSPSYSPDRLMELTDSWDVIYGVPYLAYDVKMSTATAIATSSMNAVTLKGDAVQVAFNTESPAFVMFPSENLAEDVMVRAMTQFSHVATEVVSRILDMPEGLAIGAAIPEEQLTGTVWSYSFITGMSDVTSYPVGELPDALYMHRSSGVRNTSVRFGSYFFPDGVIPASEESSGTPDTYVTLYRSLLQTSSDVNEELAEIVGYSIDRGREIRFPCFDAYGRLLSMQSWHYAEMPYEKLLTEYTKIRSGYDLYYRNSNPATVIYYHSSYFSQTRQMQIAIYHEYLDFVEKDLGPRDKYTYYVYPCESVSVSQVYEGASSFLSVDAVGPDGRKYHYIPMKNPIPKCAKYVDATKWSIMDVIHEMYLLASNLAGLCGDNGERLNILEDDLSEFDISQPRFVGQLPQNNGESVAFRFGVFQDYAERIEGLVKAIYDLKAKIVAETETL